MNSNKRHKSKTEVLALRTVVARLKRHKAGGKLKRLMSTVKRKDMINDNLGHLVGVASQLFGGKKGEKRVSRWAGPTEYGISFSGLCKFIECRERFRLRMVEGLDEDIGWKHQMQYGYMWHECEEALSAGKPWQNALSEFVKKSFEKYPDAGADIKKWANICRMHFPLYLRLFPPKKKRTAVAEEFWFSVPIQLPSGHTCKLNGVFDRLFLDTKGLWVQENKTKGEYDLEAISTSVGMNLQTMIYHSVLRLMAKNPNEYLPKPEYKSKKRDDNTSLAEHKENEKRRQQRHDKQISSILRFKGFLEQKPKIAGTYYNLIRRPLGDKFAIRQKKSETQLQFIKRIEEKILEQPHYHFQQIPVKITPEMVITFEKETLFPLLENLLDWWESIEKDPFNPWQTTLNQLIPSNAPEILYEAHNQICEHKDLTKKIPNPLHWRHPYGVYTSMGSGYRGDFYDLICKGYQGNLIVKPPKDLTDK